MKTKFLFQTILLCTVLVFGTGIPTTHAEILQEGCSCNPDGSLGCFNSGIYSVVSCPYGCDANHAPQVCKPAPSYTAAPSNKPLQYTPLEPLPFINYQNQGQSSFIPGLVNGVFKILLSIGAVFAVVMIVLAGISYMTSEVAGEKNAAKKRAQAAVIGLLLLLGAYLILKTINPNLLNVSLSIPSPTNTAASSTSPTSNSGTICGTDLCADGNNDAITRAKDANTQVAWDCDPFNFAGNAGTCFLDKQKAKAAAGPAAKQFQADQVECTSSFKQGTVLIPKPSSSCSGWDNTAHVNGSAITFTECKNIPNPTNVNYPSPSFYQNVYYVCGYDQ